jgi:hypothetical protein
VKILFLHGWHSVPGGVKPSYLVSHGQEVINPALDDDDFDAAVRTAQAEFDRHGPDVVVGSSRGGAVALNLDSGDTPLVLLCPAWKRWGTVRTAKPRITILHSRADDVIPYADSEELVRNSGLPAYILMETGTDHRLADPESLDLMHQACLMFDPDHHGGDDLGYNTVEEEPEDLLFEGDWTGLCYTAAVRWAGHIENTGWEVVHGTVLKEQGGRRIDHAWCEQGEWVVDLALPAGARFVEREDYYRLLLPEIRKRYSSEDALALSIRHRHDGPWDDTESVA